MNDARGRGEADEDRARADRAALAVAPGVLLAGMAGGIAFPILPSVGVKAGLSLAFVGTILAANRIGRIVASPIVGALSDRLGGRRLLLAGLALQVVIMGLYALGVITNDPGSFFLLGRALHGPGSACVFVAGQAIALHASASSSAGTAAGTVRAALSIGVPMGLVVGGLLSARFGPAATFELAMAALVVAFLVALVLVPDVRAKVAARPSILASFHVVDAKLGALGALNLVTSFVSGGLVLTTLVLVVGALHLSVFGFGAEATSSVAMATLVVIDGIATVTASRFAKSARAHARIAAAGIALLAPSLLILAYDPTTRGMFVGLAILGVAAGGLASALLALIGDLVVRERRGAAVGWLQLSSDVGGSLGPIVGTTLLAKGPSVPYVVAAIVALCFLPVAIYLVRALR